LGFKQASHALLSKSTSSSIISNGNNGNMAQQETK
jgi:hypothetical protein